MEFNSVCQSFDKNLWNFTKLKQEEVIMGFGKAIKWNKFHKALVMSRECFFRSEKLGNRFLNRFFKMPK